MPRIAIADDDKYFREHMSRYLASRGYEVKTVCGGEEIVRELAGEKYDVLVLDLYMDGMDGLHALPIVNKIDPELPVVIITGDTSLETERKVRSYNVYYYLNKPFTMAEMEEVIRTAIEKKTGAKGGALSKGKNKPRK